MGKFISNLFLGALAIGLSIFTGSRTLDLLAWALPANQVIYQWLGLAAFELGMYFWSFYFIAGAKGTPQRSIAVCMAVFSIAAVAIATITDMSLDAGQAGKIAPLSPAMSQAAIIFLGVVIALNVAAFLGCKLLSIDNLRLMKEQSAEDTIHTAGLTAITALAPSIAAAAAPHLAEEWANRTWQKLVPGVGHTEYIGRAPATPALSAPQQQQPTVESKPAKKGFITSLFGGGKPAAAIFEQTGSIDNPITPSEKTSNQLYREYRKTHQPVAHHPVANNAVAAKRQAQRNARLRTTLGASYGVFAPKSIDAHEPTTEKVEVPVLPLAGRVPVASQGASSQTKNTRAPGSRGKKQGIVPTATQEK